MTNPAVKKFIVLEGDEFTGKSTVRKALEAELNKRNIPNTFFREPGGTPVAEELRAILLRNEGESLTLATDILLHQAYRAQNIEHIVKPALERGDWVVSERFIFSTWCLNIAPYTETNPELADLFMGTLPFVVRDIPEPLTFILDVPEDVRQQRATGRDLDRYESKSAEHLALVSKAYHEMQGPSVVRLDGTLPVEDIVQQIIGVVEAHEARETEKLANAAVESEQRQKLMAEEPVDTTAVEEPTEEQPFDLEVALEDYVQKNIVPELFPRLATEGDDEYRANIMKYWRNLAKKIVTKIFKTTGEDKSIFDPKRVGELNREIHSLFHYKARFDYVMDDLHKDGAFDDPEHPVAEETAVNA